MKTNIGGWFEIPVNNMERAITFYEEVLQLKITPQDFGGVKMGWFPSAGEAYGATGTLIKNKNYVPSHQGTLIYLACEDLQNELNRIEAAGGKILQPKTMISKDHGHMATFEDSEGNRVALHSQK